MTSFSIVEGTPLNVEQQGLARVQTVNAPMFGWNTRDARSTMSPQDAIFLDNMFVDVAEPDGRLGSVSSRNGYEEYATGLGDDVETLAEYSVGTSIDFLAAAGANIYDVSSDGAVGAALGTGYSSARWQTQNFSTLMFLCNGADDVQQYNGSTISTSTFTGVTLSSLIDVNAFKNRLYFIEKDSTSFWYGGKDSVSGALSEFDLATVRKHGGNLLTMATWTRDGGSGVDDYAVFFFTSGEVLVYQGSNPGDADDWALVGSYRIGKPLSRRGVIEFAGDVVVMTNSGNILLSEEISKDATVTNKSRLSGAAINAARSYGSNYGWEAISYPRRAQILFNVPLSNNNIYNQYVVSTVNRAASRFKGMNARTWGVYNERLYFGGNGIVYLADEGQNDDGNAIDILIQTAFTNLGSPARKSFKEFVPILDADGNVDFDSRLAYDFGGTLEAQLVSSTSSGTPWGSPWGSPWSPENITRVDAFTATGDGTHVSLTLQASLLNQKISLHGIKYSYEIQSLV